MSKLRVATVYLGRHGGGPIYALSMAKALNEICVQRVFISRNVENFEDWINSSIDLRYFQTFERKSDMIWSMVFPRKTGSVIKQILQFSPDVIYYPMGHLWNGKISVSAKGNDRDVTIVETMHDPIAHSGENKGLFKLARRVLDGSMKSADKCIILSSVFKDYVKENYGFEDQNIIVLPHGVFDYYTKFVSNNSGTLQKRAKFRIGFVGRISKYKGIDVLLEAFLELQRQIDVELLVAGSGQFQEIERSLISRIPQEKITVINKWLSHEEIAQCISSLDVLVCAYRDGTQSGVVSAAYALGVPVIVSDSGGLPEQAGYGKYALISKAGDFRSLMECVRNLLNDSSLIMKITNESRKHSTENLSWSVLAKRLIGFFESGK